MPQRPKDKVKFDAKCLENGVAMPPIVSGLHVEVLCIKHYQPAVAQWLHCSIDFVPACMRRWTIWAQPVAKTASFGNTFTSTVCVTLSVYSVTK